MKIPLLLFTGAFMFSCTYLPLDMKVSGLEITETRDYIELVPTAGISEPDGLMFWPGGLVDPHAYVSSLGRFSLRGFRVVILKVPMNLAILDTDKGLDIARRLGGTWVASGHSLGGTAAAWTVHDNPGFFQGLALVASYTTEDKSLADWNGTVVSISGSEDKVASPQDLADTRDLLPPPGYGNGQTNYFEITGANHGQFGDYGPQDGDGTATISPEDQWEALADGLSQVWYLP